MTVNDLPREPKGAILKCFGPCRGEYSALRADYFLWPPDREMTCGQCGEPLQLVRKETTFRFVAPMLILALFLPAIASAETTQTLTASAYGRSGCRAALLNVSRVQDSQGTHTWASYTIWTCAPGSSNPEQVVSQQSILIPDYQFLPGQGNSPWNLVLQTGEGAASLRWTPDGRVHSTFDQAWTSSIAGQTPTKTTKSLTTDSAPTTGVLFGVTADAVSGTVMRGQDTSK